MYTNGTATNRPIPNKMQPNSTIPNRVMASKRRLGSCPLVISQLLRIDSMAPARSSTIAAQKN